MSSDDDEPYELRVGAAAARALSIGPPRGLPTKLSDAVTEFISGPLLTNPYRVGKPLEKELTGYHSARRGAYRVIYRIEANRRIVRIVRIEHRSDVYRSR